MRGIFSGALIALLVLVVAGVAYAGSRHGGGYHNGGYHNSGGHMSGVGPCGGKAYSRFSIPADQMEGFKKSMDSYQKEFSKLHMELRTKQMELDYLAGNSKVEPKVISGLVKEVSTLQGQLFELRAAKAVQLEKDFGITEAEANWFLNGHGYRMGREGGDCPAYGTHNNSYHRTGHY